MSAPLRSLAVLVLALGPSCEKVEKTMLPPGPPAPSEILGAYAAHYQVGQAVLEGQAAITDELARLVSYPCFPPGLEEIATAYEYDPASGAFAAEGKTVGGEAHLLVLGTFGASGEFEGSYRVDLFGETCALGALRLTR